MKSIVLLTLIVISGWFNSSNSQSREKLLLRIDSLKALLAKADTLSPFDDRAENMFDTITVVNTEIFKTLAAVVTDPAIVGMNVDSIFRETPFTIATSPDQRLRIFSWYENTGGSWKSYLNLINYKTVTNALKVDSSTLQGDGVVDRPSSEIGIYSVGAWYDTIFPLRVKDRCLYLCIGRAITCNTCVVEVATVVELTKDGIRFDYPAFIDGYESGEAPYSPAFLLESRMGSVEYFRFDPKTQTLSFRYTTDDNTPVKGEEGKVITRKLKFDGKKFLGNGYE